MQVIDGISMTDDEVREYQASLNQGWSEQAQQDPTFNPRDALVAHDANSWGQWLQNAARDTGATYDPSDLEDIKRNVSYHQNAGKDPLEFLQAKRAQYVVRGQSGGDRTKGGYDTRLSDDPAERARQAGPSFVGDQRHRTVGDWGIQSDAWYPGATRTGTGGGPSSGFAPSTSTLGNWAEYQPFTERFTGPSAPADLATPWGRTFTPPTMPADLMAPWTEKYVRPTAADLESDPGYQVRQDAQQRGMERSAAARGTLLTGGLQRSLAEYGQELGSNEYQRLVDRSMQEYQNAFNVFTGDKARRQGVFGDQFNQALTGYRTDFDTDQADKMRRGAEFGNQYGRSLGEFGMRRDISDTNQMNRLNTQMAQRGFDLGERTADRNYGLSLGSQDLANRQFGFGVDESLFQRNRSSYLDQANIWNMQNRNWWDSNSTLGQFGMPS